MLVRRRQALEVLSISALDIFASALGVFVLMAILLFPYYLKQPSIEADRAGAEAELAAAADDVREAREAVDDAMQERAEAETARAEAQARLEQAEAAAARAAEDPEIEETPPPERGSRGEKKIPVAIANLDLVFVMDTTGSMRHELADLQANLVGIVRVLHRLATSLRVGFVAFKDRSDAYLTKVYPLQRMNDAHVAELVDFVNRLSAKGGGDDPEPVDEALRVALAMPWRADGQGRIIVIGDAPAHNRTRTFDLAERFRRSAGEGTRRSVSAIYTSRDPATRPFFEQLAAAGGGDFSVHQGQMTESVLLSVLDEGAAR